MDHALISEATTLDHHEILTALPSFHDSRDIADHGKPDMKPVHDNHGQRPTKKQKHKHEATKSGNFGSFHLRKLSASLDTVTSKLPFLKPTQQTMIHTGQTSSSTPHKPVTFSCSSLSSHRGEINSSSLTPNPPPRSPLPPTALTSHPSSTPTIDLNTLSRPELDYLSTHPLTDLPRPVLVSLVNALQSQIEDLVREMERLRKGMKDLRREGDKRIVDGHDNKGEVVVKEMSRLRNDLRDSGLGGVASLASGSTGVEMGEKVVSTTGGGRWRKWENRKSGVSDWETVVEEMEVGGV